MRYHFFLRYGWFFQYLGKEAVRTFMHTTVHHNSVLAAYYNFVNKSDLGILSEEGEIRKRVVTLSSYESIQLLYNAPAKW